MNRHSTRAKNGGEPSSQRLLERYKQHLDSAEFKMLAGDRIGAENELQHAEHFLRTAAEQKAITDAGPRRNAVLKVTS